MGWRRYYYYEPTTKAGRRVQTATYVLTLFLLGFFTFGVTWICLVFFGFWSIREFQEQERTKALGNSKTGTMSGEYLEIRLPDEFPGFVEWCEWRYRSIGYDQPPEHMVKAIETGNPDYLPTLIHQEFLRSHVYRDWKKSKQKAD